METNQYAIYSVGLRYDISGIYRAHQELMTAPYCKCWGGDVAAYLDNACDGEWTFRPIAETDITIDWGYITNYKNAHVIFSNDTPIEIYFAREITEDEEVDDEQ